MAYIKLTLDHPLVDGESITFKAPCDCTEISGVKIYYVTVTDSVSTEMSKTFVFRDAHGNDLTNSGNLFVNGSYIKIILDVTNGYAYIQNSDTNAYLENKFSMISSSINTHTHPASKITAGTFAGQVVANSSNQTPTTYLIRNSKISDTEETPTVNGQICWQRK